MKNIITFSSCLFMAVSMQAQTIRVNLANGEQKSFNQSEVVNVEFAPTDYKGKWHYATTDMSFAEFFAGEIQQSASSLLQDGVDVVTSATGSKSSRFTACTTSNDGQQITGVKSVSVCMTDEVYKKLSKKEKERFTFVEDSVFASSKQLKADGSFSAYTKAPVVKNGVEVNLLSGYAAKWGNYVITLGIDRNEIPSGNLQGAVLTTTSGQKFALRPLNNLWLNTAEMAFCVSDFVEPHGLQRSYSHTAGLQGKTISCITYYLKDNDNVAIPCNIYVKQQTRGNVSVEGAALAGSNPLVYLQMNEIPEDAGYTIAAVKKGQGKKAVELSQDAYSYKDNVLTIKGEIAPDDVYSVIFNSDKYVSIGTDIKFAKDPVPTEFQNKLKGTYVELFSQKGVCASKWDKLWIEECAKFVGQEQAEATAQMLKASVTGTLTGAEAIAKYGDGSKGMPSDFQFNCGYTLGIQKLIFDGCTIKGLGINGNEIFSHRYIKVGYDAKLDFHYYKSIDGNNDEFTYFFMRSDNPIDTYHIEFRYGNKTDDLLGFITGKYAYWMAAGVLENNDEQCEKSIRLFVDENLQAMSNQ